MHSSSADTSYTFGDNTVPVADGGNQSSPGTGDSGTAMEWNNISSRGRSSASNRSSRATSKRDQQHRGQRTSRRSTTRSATPKATHDRPSRTGETSGKHPRRTGDSSRIEAKDGIDNAYTEIMEYQGYYEVELMQNHLLEEQVERLEGVVESKSKVIDDIEVKFTEYLRGYNDNVNSEISVLNEMLSQSAAEVREYQVELMVAAQDDQGSTMRMQNWSAERT